MTCYVWYERWTLKWWVKVHLAPIVLAALPFTNAQIRHDFVLSAVVCVVYSYDVHGQLLAEDVRQCKVICLFASVSSFSLAWYIPCCRLLKTGLVDTAEIESLTVPRIYVKITPSGFKFNLAIFLLALLLCLSTFLASYPLKQSDPLPQATYAEWWAVHRLFHLPNYCLTF